LKDIRESGHDLFEGTVLALPGQIEENFENPLSGQK
jgi:hypothetical protein